MSVRLSPEAAADLEGVFGWYAERSRSLGLEFLSAVAQALGRIGAFPESGEQLDPGLRRVPLRRFPYLLFYAIDARGPVVLGCFHAHRDPQVWHVRSRR